MIIIGIHGHFTPWLDRSKLLQVGLLQHALDYALFFHQWSTAKPNLVTCVEQSNF